MSSDVWQAICRAGTPQSETCGSGYYLEILFLSGINQSAAFVPPLSSVKNGFPVWPPIEFLFYLPNPALQHLPLPKELCPVPLPVLSGDFPYILPWPCFILPHPTVPLAWGLPEEVGSPASVPGKLTSIGPWQRRR